MEKTKVICLIGASGSGKSTIAEQLGGNVIQSYTTRLPRYMGEPGHVYIEDIKLLDDEMEIIHYPDIITELQQIQTIYKSDIVAYANLYDEHYFATLDQFVDGLNIYVVNPDGAEQVERYFANLNVEVITVYIQVDEDIRKDRLLNREYDDYMKEVLERLDSDRRAFKTVRCNYTINGNGSIEDVVERVRMLL